MSSTLYLKLFAIFFIAIVQLVASENNREWDVERSSVNPLSYTEETHYARFRTNENPALFQKDTDYDPHYARKQSCKGNETYSYDYIVCKNRDTCENYRKPIFCPRIRRYDCYCKSGYVRGADKQCIRKKDCPSKANAEAQPSVYPPFTDDDFHIPNMVSKNPLRPETENPHSEKTEILPITHNKIIIPGDCNGSSSCFSACKLKGYSWGLCTGPEKKSCQCYTRIPNKIASAVDPEEIEPTTSEPRDKISVGGCPSNKLCNAKCRRDGLRWGRCTGLKKDYCVCHSKSPVKSVTTAGPDEIESYTRDHRDSYVTYNTSPYTDDDHLVPNAKTRNPDDWDTVNTPSETETPLTIHSSDKYCPSVHACIFYCKLTGKKTGKCTGPGERNCECVNYSNNKPDSSVDTDEMEPNSTESRKNDMSTISSIASCPSDEACTESCSDFGYTHGHCVGTNSDVCSCYNESEKKAKLGDFYADINPCPDHNACQKLCTETAANKKGECVGPNFMTCRCHS